MSLEMYKTRKYVVKSCEPETSWCKTRSTKRRPVIISAGSSVFPSVPRTRLFQYSSSANTRPKITDLYGHDASFVNN